MYDSQLLAKGLTREATGNMDDAEKRQVYWQMYMLMRQEIVQLNQDIRRIQLFAVVGVGAIYSYLFTNASSEGPIPELVWFLVPFLVLMAWLPSHNTRVLRDTKALYLKTKVERMIFGELEVNGWETYYEKNQPEMPSFMNVYWPTLLIITLIIAVSRILSTEML